MIKFEGSSQYSKETLYQLYKTTNEIYGMKKILKKLLLGFALALAGLFLDLPMILQGILLMSGAWLMVSKDFPARMKAEDVLETRGNHLPELKTKFYDGHLELSSSKKMKLSYRDIEHLSEVNGLMMIFFSKDSAIVIDNESLTGETMEELKDFLEDRTNLTFRQSRSFLSMSLKDLMGLIRKS